MTATNAPTALGHKYKDRVTGFEGVATCLAEVFAGTVQIGLQPPVKDDDNGTFKDAMFIDIHQLEDLGLVEGITVIAPPVVPIKLGEQVEDKVTGYKGIVVEKITFLNGCVYLLVQAKPKKEGEAAPDSVRAGYQRFKSVGKGLTEDTVLAAKQAEPAAKRTGGPTRRSDFARKV